LLSDVSQSLKTLLLESVAGHGYAIDADAALAARGEKPPSDFQKRLAVARSLEAENILDVRLVRVGELCYLSTSIVEATGGGRSMVSSQQAACDKDGLQRAAEKIADLLTYPPKLEKK